MIDTEALRKKVIDLAIQGKLTKQLPSDGDAESLYSQIQTEKAKLVKAGKIKKEKPLPEITDDEIPFEIPENWKWVRLNDIFDISGGSQPPKSMFRDEPQKGYIRLYQIRDYGEKPVPVYVPTDSVSKFSKEGDVLLARYGGSLGKVFLAHDGAYNVAIAKVIPLFSDALFHNRYCYYYFNSSLYQSFIRKQSSSRSAQSGFNRDDMDGLLFPLPPLEVQYRVSDIIDSINPILNDISDLQIQYSNDLSVLKSKIIDAAIYGKLTEQLPEDGTAEELYTKIQEEKAKLIKEGKIKKEKPLADIEKDEIPFEIPRTWKWIRWGELSEKIQYGYNAPAKPDGRIKMVRISDIQDGEVKWDTVPYCDIDDKDIDAYLLRENDILFARTGGTVGKSYIVSSIPEEAIYAGYLIRTSYSSKICARYMKYFMESELYWKQLREGTIATAQPNCNGKTLSKMIVPFPPYNEQVRIADKIDEMLEVIAVI